MTYPRCPRCESTELEPCDQVLEASDRSESVHANLRCGNPKCRAAFRYIEPADPWRPTLYAPLPPPPKGSP